MKRTISACAALAALTTLAVAVGTVPANAADSTGTGTGTESLFDYHVEGVAPTLVDGGLQFAAVGGQPADAFHEEGVALADVAELGFTVAVAPADGGADPAYVLGVDTDGTSASRMTLSAEPYQNGLALNAAGDFDVTGWKFWSSGLAESADGGKSSPEPLSWFEDQYPEAEVVAHGLRLDSTESSSAAVVSGTSFDGMTTDFTLGTASNPIASSTAPADGTEVTPGELSGIDPQSGIGTKTDAWTAPSAFGPIHYAVTSSAKDPAAVGGLAAPSITQPAGELVASSGRFVWHETAQGTVTVPAVDGGSWAIDGTAATPGVAQAFPDGSHTISFTPDSGRAVYPLDVPAGGTLGPDGSVEFAVALAPGADGGVAAVTSSAAPKVSGTAQIGKTLTATTGTFSPSTAKVTYQWLASGAPISGAVAQTYTPTSASLVGKKLSVAVTARLDGYTAYVATSAQTAAVATGSLTAPTPTITGTAAVNQTLTAKPGTWTSGTTLRYQWYASGAAISKATASTFKLSSAQKGKKITVKVTGSKSGYASVAKTSPARGPVTAGVVSGPAPTISGTAKVGVTLTAKAGTWTSGSTISYRWYANGAAISGATKSTFVPAAAQLGAKVTVTVTATKSGWSSNSKSSAATAAVASGSLASAVPTIAGIAAKGQTLTAKAGAWTSGTALSYQWFAGGAPIAGATAATLKLGAEQEGLPITVKVTGTKAGYTTVTKTSAASGKVTLGLVSGPAPKISGTVKVGATLTAAPGTWTSGSALSYRWYQNGVAISGATSARLALTAGLYQKVITVRVTGAIPGWTSSTVASAPTAKVAAGTLTAATPTISGTDVVGSTLVANRGGWTAGTSFTYQWYRNGAAIRGATGASYRLVSADAPYPITVRVTGAKSGYVSVAKTSAPTRRVSPGDSVNCSNFSTWAQAQAWYKKYYPYFGDVAKLDADHDGSACDALR